MVDPHSGSFPSEKDSLYAVHDRDGYCMANRGDGFAWVAIVGVVVSPHLVAWEEPRELV